MSLFLGDRAFGSSSLLCPVMSNASIKFMTILLSIFLIAWIVTPKQDEDTQQDIVRVPTIVEMQILVGAEPDGIVGPKFIKKWEDKICQQYADDNWPKGEQK